MTCVTTMERTEDEEARRDSVDQGQRLRTDEPLECNQVTSAQGEA